MAQKKTSVDFIEIERRRDLDFVNYPPTTGSPRLVKKFTHQPLPDWWVGRSRSKPKFAGLPQALGLGEGETSKVIRLADPRVDVHIDVTSAGLRSVQAGKYISRVGFEPSAKARMALQTESRAERWFVNLSEIDPGIVDIRTQGVKIEGVDRFITLDAMRLTAAGQIQAVEVKSDPNRIGKANYIDKLAWAKEVCDRVGFEFVLATTDCFAGQNVLEHNVRVVSQELFTDIASRTVAIVNLAFAAGEKRLRFIFEKLGGDTFARSQLLAMIARGQICCDLSCRLTLDTLVWKGRGRAHG